MALGAYVSPIGEPGKRPPLRAQRSLRPATRTVALLGFGTVGRAVAQILCRTPESHLRLTHVFNRSFERKRVDWVPDRVQWTDNFHEVLNSNADTVVELLGGLEPAHEYIRQALISGKSVITANKHVMAKYGPELLELARRHGQQLEYGASVGGGLPVLAALHYGLAGDRLLRACGILNGTCNFILSNMEAKGTSLAATLAEAQKLGYAEADPSDDVNGLDAACKLAIVARLGLRAELNAFEIPRQSIANIQPSDFRYARQLGCTIRQISLAELDGQGVYAAVTPALVPLNSPLAAATDNQNAIIFKGERSGETLLVGKGAGGDPTAVAVVSDLLAIREGPCTPATSLAEKYPVAHLSCPHYLRVSGENGVDVLDALAPILDQHGVALEKSLEHSDKGKREWALTTEACGTGVVRELVRDLAQRERISESPLCLPILNSE
jgi:homoserine dehydrogenase